MIDGPITASGSFAADGDSVTRIAASVDPGAWSIDRSRFAFQVADDSGRVEVCVLAVGARRVTGGAVELAAGALYAPGAVQLWSADNALVMNHWTTAVDLVSLDPTDGNRRKLADGGMFDISADGRSLATIVGDREHPVVSIVDLHAGTSRAVPVTARELMPTAPRWLTHHRLAFHARGLVVIDLETRAETTLFVEQANATIGNFAFSRAGDNVAWSVTGPSPSPDHGLHIRDPSGLVANTGILADPLAWNTDGTLLLATSCDDRSCSLQVIDVGDKTTRPIAQTSSNELRFTSRSGWVADGSIEFGVMSFPRAR